jgi:hypothetical protein
MSRKVYCIKTMYNKNDRFGLNESTDYVLFKKGHFYETELGSYMTLVVNSNGLKFTIDSTYVVSEQEWRESRLKDLGL